MPAWGGVSRGYRSAWPAEARGHRGRIREKLAERRSRRRGTDGSGIAANTIGIVMVAVRSGLVASFNRPAGNITGVAALTIELDPKRLELLHELAPSGGPLAVLLNPSRTDTQIQLDGIKTAARSLGRELVLGYANTIQQIETAFAIFAGIRRGTAGRCRSIVQQLADTDYCARNSAWLARDISMARICACRWPGKLRTEPFRFLPTSWSVRCPHSQGRKALRPPGAATDKVRVRHQSQDR
jgi:hypothetical protein